MTKRQPTTVVFVDIVGSTELAASIGDERWAILLERYRRTFRRELAAAEGEEMDAAGDGLFAVFADAAAAVAFGCSVGRVVQPLGLRLRVGIHAGTCWIADDKCAGLDVNVGARIAGAAAPGEVLVSAPVQSRLAEDSRFVFRQRGEAELRGVPGHWSLYAAEIERRSFHDHDQGRGNRLPEP